jgi:hypothetical protein
MRRALFLMISLTACLDAAAGNVANVPTPTGTTPREASERRVFSTGLTALPAAQRRGAKPSFARGRVELKLRRDSTLEYHLNLYNPAGETFTAAHVYRVERGERRAPAVVTLFTGASMRDKYIQVRGTGVLMEPGGTSALLEELRANPAAFYVSLRTTREPQGALRGVIK